MMSITASDVKFPLQFDDLKEDTEFGFFVSQIIDEDSASSDNFIDLIEEFVVFVQSEVNVEQQQIDTMYNAVSCVKILSDEQKTDFLESLMSLCSNKMEGISDQSTTKDKNDLKISSYFLHMCALKLETHFKQCHDSSPANQEGSEESKKGKGKGKKSRGTSSTFSWGDWRPAILKIYLRLLAVDPSLLWFMGIPDEVFLQGMWKYGLTLLEDKPVGISGSGQQEVALRNTCSGIILNCARQICLSFSSGDELTTIVTAIVDSICRVEHMGTCIADVCKLDNGRFVSAIMTEIGSMNLSELGKSGSGVKHLGAFLVSLSECAPHLMSVYLPMFIHQLDSDVYQIR